MKQPAVPKIVLNTTFYMWIMLFIFLLCVFVHLYHFLIVVIMQLFAFHNKTLVQLHTWCIIDLSLLSNYYYKQSNLNSFLQIKQKFKGQNLIFALVSHTHTHSTLDIILIKSNYENISKEVSKKYNNK